MNERKSKNIVIIALCITLIFMGVGFSALTANLEINGTATVSGEWNVQITNIQPVALYDNSLETPVETAEASTISAYLAKNENNAYDFEATSATFTVDLAQPGDYLIYEVTVTNGGNIAATLASLVSGVDGTDSAAIVYTLLEAPEEDASLAVNGTHTYKVKVEYSKDATGANAPDLTQGALTEKFNVTAVYNQA